MKNYKASILRAKISKEQRNLLHRFVGKGEYNLMLYPILFYLHITH